MAPVTSPALAGHSPISLGRPAAPSVAGRTTRALGTFCSVLVNRPAMLGAAQDILSADLAAMDLACSRFRPDSELAGLNRADGQAVTVSPLFGAALATALRAAEITDGDVDPTCGRSLVSIGYDRDYDDLAGDTSELTQQTTPAAGWRCVEFDAERLTVRVPAGVMLDFGATAKALAADRAATAIWTRLGCGVLVNLGGDICVAGPAPDGGWRVGVDDGVTSPRSGSAAPVVAIQAGGVATSCPSVRSWRRGGRELHHIVVPGTGQPAEVHWEAVTVAAATCVDANTASTASIIKGRAATAWLEEARMPARLVSPDGLVLTTGGWPG
jgi:thiamine biosynthesis lipoprotein